MSYVYRSRSLTFPSSVSLCVYIGPPHRPSQVHAKGFGAHGYFETTHDVSDLTCASLFKKVGTRARTTLRISTVGGESGSPDTARDPRGFAIKIRTDEGNLDWVFNNTPVFFIRDPGAYYLRRTRHCEVGLIVVV